MKWLLRKLFCKHENKKFIRNIYGDEINHQNARSLHRCQDCGKIIRSGHLYIIK